MTHGFRTTEDPERKQTETFHFLKNSALLGAAPAFLGLGLADEGGADE